MKGAPRPGSPSSAIPSYGRAICGGCGDDIHNMSHDPKEPKWATYGDTVNGYTGVVEHRVYIYDCGDERNSHYPIGDDPEPLEPRIVGHRDNEPISAEGVRSAYANLIDGINRANTVLPEQDRFHVPFGVQEALVRYIEEYETIESIKKAMP